MPNLSHNAPLNRPRIPAKIRQTGCLLVSFGKQNKRAVPAASMVTELLYTYVQEAVLAQLCPSTGPPSPWTPLGVPTYFSYRKQADHPPARLGEGIQGRFWEALWLTFAKVPESFPGPDYINNQRNLKHKSSARDPTPGPGPGFLYLCRIEP